MALPPHPNKLGIGDLINEFGVTHRPTRLSNFRAGQSGASVGEIGYPRGVPTRIPTDGTISIGNYHGYSRKAWMVIRDSMNWVCQPGFSRVTAILIAGGGGGGSKKGIERGGGGGAGGFLMFDVNLTPGQTYKIVIGEGGGPNRSGGNSSAFNRTAIGGGYGGGGNGTVRGAMYGGDGGSGGGGNGWFGNARGGFGTPGQGNNGGQAREEGHSGGGGGAGGWGGRPNGGPGISLRFLDLAITVCWGGDAGVGPVSAPVNSGAGGGGAKSGANAGYGGSGVLYLLAGYDGPRY